MGSQESDRTEHTQQHVPPVRISQPPVHWCLSSVLIYLSQYILQMCLPSGPFWHLVVLQFAQDSQPSVGIFYPLSTSASFNISLMLDLAKSSIQVRSPILFHFPRHLWWFKHQDCFYITLKKVEMKKCFRIYEN